MNKWHELGEKITRYLRPATFPLAVRIAGDAAELENDFRRPPARNFLCQNLTMGRRYGWTIKVLPEDCSCLLARGVYGWESGEAYEAEALLGFAVGLYAKGVEGEKRFVETLEPLRKRAAGVLISPLERSKIEPEVALVFGNAAQMMRLVQSYLYVKGGVLDFSAAGRLGSCTDGIAKAINLQQPRLVILGNGDRVWAMAHDDELLFAVPAALLADLVEGLEATHRAGLRYPVPHYLNFTPGFQAEFEQRAMQRAGTTIAKKES
jgi:uncharacterized protein (DUF169 family)